MAVDKNFYVCYNETEQLKLVCYGQQEVIGMPMFFSRLFFRLRCYSALDDVV